MKMNEYSLSGRQLESGPVREHKWWKLPDLTDTPSGPRTYPDELVQKAWMWFLGKMTQDSQLMGGAFKEPEGMTPELADWYLKVVNDEIRRCGAYDLFPEKMKL